jgi:hypothetical protein
MMGNRGHRDNRDLQKLKKLWALVAGRVPGSYQVLRGKGLRHPRS